MTREIYIVGNWKMNQKISDIESFFNAMKKIKGKYNCNAWVAPQAMHIETCLRLGKDNGILVGSQNCADHQSGAYTGELSPLSLKDIGAHFSIIGHSERRHIYGEVDNYLNAKTLLALQSGLWAIFCVGEKLEEREAGKTNEVVKRQVTEGLKNIPSEYHDRIIIAYEPVWAIGTGKTATPQQAQEVHSFIRNELLEQINLDAKAISILYGGSVKPGNISELMAREFGEGWYVAFLTNDPLDGRGNLTDSNDRVMITAVGANLILNDVLTSFFRVKNHN